MLLCPPLSCVAQLGECATLSEKYCVRKTWKMVLGLTAVQKTWISTANRHCRHEAGAEQGRSNQGLRATHCAPWTIAVSPRFCSNIKQLVLHQLKMSNEIKSLCLIIKYLGLNFSSGWDVLEINSSTYWDLKKLIFFSFFHLFSQDLMILCIFRLSWDHIRTWMGNIIGF